MIIAGLSDVFSTASLSSELMRGNWEGTMLLSRFSFVGVILSVFARSSLRIFVVGVNIECVLACMFSCMLASSFVTVLLSFHCCAVVDFS